MSQSQWIKIKSLAFEMSVCFLWNNKHIILARFFYFLNDSANKFNCPRSLNPFGIFRRNTYNGVVVYWNLIFKENITGIFEYNILKNIKGGRNYLRGWDNK